jgi:enoyl-CoA hydratase/carnithine racemase
MSMKADHVALTCFKVEIADNIAHIELAQPDRLNAMTREFWTELS